MQRDVLTLTLHARRLAVGKLIAKYQRRFLGFDEKIISMYARGMSTREIQGHLRDLYLRGTGAVSAPATP